MRLEYLVPICSFSPNQKKKKKHPKKTPKKIYQTFRVQCFLGFKKKYNPKKKRMFDSNRKMSSSLECSHLFFFSLEKKKNKKHPKTTKKNMKFLGFIVYLGLNNNLNPKKKKTCSIKTGKCQVV